MTVGELAKLLHKDASEVIKKLMLIGVMATINQDARSGHDPARRRRIRR